MASNNRKKATDDLLGLIDALAPGNPNVELLRNTLEGYSDAEFEQFVVDLEEGRRTIHFFSPNDGKYPLSTERNLKIAEHIGHEFFQTVLMTDPDTGVVYESPIKRLLVDWPVRRQAQTIAAKISVAENDQHIDQLTDQPTGPSKSSKLTNPEMQLLYAQGYDRLIEELIKDRGGDMRAYRTMKNLLITDGSASQDIINRTPSRVKSTVVISTILKAMHLANDL